MKKLIISGGPHTGKTTLLQALQKELPQFTYLPEPATNIIQREQHKEQEQPNYTGKFPWNNYPEFGKLVIQESLDLESQIPQDAEIAILDRSLIDTVAYAAMSNATKNFPKLPKLIQQANYTAVFFCDFVGEYTATEVRSENKEQAKQTQEALKKTYKQSHLEYIPIPATSVQNRMQIIKNCISNL